MTTDAETRMQEYIRNTPATPSRKEGFLADFRAKRQQCGSVELVFRRVDLLREEAEWRDESAYGFNVFLHKGPFVEGSNWLPFRTWEFAVAMERHLMGRFESHLSALERTGDVPAGWPEMLNYADSVVTANTATAAPSWVIVITGRLPTDVTADLLKREYAVPSWRLPEHERSQWIIAHHNDLPVLAIPESTEATINVIDLHHFGQLVRYDDLQFSVDEFDEDRAREMIREKPDLFQTSSESPLSDEERIRELRLRVGVRLFESYDMRRFDGIIGARARITLPA